MRSLYLIGGLICRGIRGNSVPSWRSIVIFKAAIFLLALSPSWVMAEEAKIFDHVLGDHIVDFPIDTAEVLDSDIDGYAGQTFIRIMAPEATEIALTFEASSQKLHYIEHDWIDRSKTASTAALSGATKSPDSRADRAGLTPAAHRSTGKFFCAQQPCSVHWPHQNVCKHLQQPAAHLGLRCMQARMLCRLANARRFLRPRRMHERSAECSCR